MGQYMLLLQCRVRDHSVRGASGLSVNASRLRSSVFVTGTAILEAAAANCGDDLC